MAVHGIAQTKNKEANINTNPPSNPKCLIMKRSKTGSSFVIPKRAWAINEQHNDHPRINEEIIFIRTSKNSQRRTTNAESKDQHIKIPNTI